MTDTAPSSPARAGQGLRLLVDVGPIAIFMIAYNIANRTRPDEAIFIATAVFIAATLAALGYARLKEKRWPLLLLVTAVVVTLFGGATLLLRDSLFIKIKPTVINLLYAAAIFGSLLVRQNIWKVLFGGVFSLPDRAWRTLAIRWGVFFVFLAILNEVVWRNFSQEFWVNFKFFGVLPLTFLFALAQTPLLLKHGGPAESEQNTGPME